MNQLFAIMDIDLRGFPLDIYLAFDGGEYLRREDPEGTIPWQKYTLPDVMQALAEEGLLASRVISESCRGQPARLSPGQTRSSPHGTLK